MSTKPDDGGPAFTFENDARHTGMSLRDWFAGHALPSCISVVFGIEASGHLMGDAWQAASESAYRFADAMLKARQQHD
jgi:hypothetical protein